MFLLSGAALSAQVAEIGIAGGGAIYYGDMTPQDVMDVFRTVRPAGGVYGRFHFTDRLALRASVSRLILFGDDRFNGWTRALNFRTPVTEASIMGELSLFRIYLFHQAVFAMPYIHGGVGHIWFNPTGRYQEQWVDLQPLGTEGQGLPGYPLPYALSTLVVPCGGGVKFVAGYRWVIGLEGTLRFTNTDYLDDLSTGRVSYNELLENKGLMAAQIARPSFNPETDDPNEPFLRGGAARDFYFSGQLTIGMLLGDYPESGRRGGRGRPRVRCYEF